jgi:hypothetical protein
MCGTGFPLSPPGKGYSVLTSQMETLRLGTHAVSPESHHVEKQKVGLGAGGSRL